MNTLIENEDLLEIRTMLKSRGYDWSFREIAIAKILLEGERKLHERSEEAFTAFQVGTSCLMHLHDAREKMNLKEENNAS